MWPAIAAAIAQAIVAKGLQKAMPDDQVVPPGQTPATPAMDFTSLLQQHQQQPSRLGQLQIQPQQYPNAY